MEKTKLELLLEEAEKLKPEDSLERINKMSEENKILVAILDSQGLSQELSIICTTKGIKDYESYLAYIYEAPKNQIYKLSAIPDSDLSIQNQTDSSCVYQNSQNQLILEDSVNGHKRVGFKLPLSIFKSINSLCKEVAIRLAVEGIPSEGQSVFGISLGDLKIHVENGNIHVGETLMWNTNEEVLTFRIAASISGEVKVIFENQSNSTVVFSRRVFNGINIGEIGLELDSGHAAHLLMLEVYNGQLTGTPTTAIQRHQRINNFERLVNIKTKSPNMDKLRLKILGIDQSQIDTALASSRTLGEAVAYSLKTFNPASYSFTPSDDCILELQIFNTASEIPHDFQVVRTLQGYNEIESDIMNRKVLA